jgi:cAMP-dependent protein kinase regulator
MQHEAQSTVIEPDAITGDEGDLAQAVEMLEADPGTLWVWLRVALLLHQDPDASQADRAQARQALDNVAGALGEAGQLPLALVACLRLAEFGEERTSWTRLLGLANAYGKLSSRVDPAAKARPPAPPSPISAVQEVPGAVLRARAVSALRKAAAHAITVQQMAAAQSRQLRVPLPPVPLFSALLPDAFVKLAQQLEIQELPASARVFSAGDLGESLYIIARGTVRIERADRTVLARLRAGSFFGEMALMTGARRMAHAIAETPLLLLRAGRSALEALGSREEEVASVLAEHTRRRLLSNAMMSSQLFQVVGPKARADLIGRFTFRRYPAGAQLIQDGQPGSELFVILAGQAEVARREVGTGALLPIATLGIGDVVGEMALLSERPTSAAVFARDATTVLVLSRADFEKVIARYPEVRQALADLAERRRRANDEEPVSRLATPELLFEEEAEILV